MADRQRNFLMAANHFRAGRITIDEFKNKVFESEVGQVLVVAMEDGLKAAADSAKETAQAHGAAVTLAASPDDPTVSQWRGKIKKDAGAVVILAGADTEAVFHTAQRFRCPVFIVPGSASNVFPQTTQFVELASGDIVIVATENGSTAGKLAAKIARR